MIQGAIGFSLVRATDAALRSNAGGFPPFRRIIFGGGNLIGSELIAVGDLIDTREFSIARFSRIECAGYVPYVNRNLFLRIVNIETASGQIVPVTEDIRINDVLVSNTIIEQTPKAL